MQETADGPHPSMVKRRRLDICIFVANGLMVLTPRTSGVNIEFLTQRKPFAFGNPNLTIGLYVARLGVRAIHRRRFAVHGFVL